MNINRFFILDLLLFITFISLPFTLDAKSNSNTLRLSNTVDGGIVFSINIVDVEITRNIYNTEPSIIIHDGIISELWKTIPSNEIYSYGEYGSIKSAYGSLYIYFLLTHDVDIEWIAVQWDSDFTGDPELKDNGVIPMEKDDDIWIFGETPETGIFGDARSAGQGEFPYIIADVKNDLVWERILVNDTDGRLLYYSWEIMRLIDTNDFDQGKDVVFSKDTNLTMMTASNLHHGIENEITQMKHVMSENKIGSNSSEKSMLTTEIDFDRFIRLAFRDGMYYGIASITLTVFPSIFIFKRRKNI